MAPPSRPELIPPLAPQQGNAPPPVLVDELIAEILSRVPVKSLLQFRCVCKLWKSLIFDIQFVKKHLRRSTTDSHFTHHRFTPKVNITPSSFVSSSLRSLFDNASIISDTFQYRFNKPYLIVGACNGLLCLAYFSFEKRGIEQWFCLWNPTIRLRSEKSPSLFTNYGLNSACVHGFGYDHLTDTFKVVSVFYDPKNDLEKAEVKVYSLGASSWRKAQGFPAVPSTIVTKHKTGEFVNGTLNWVAISKVNSVGSLNTVSIDQLVIVSLDLGNETFRKVLLPDDLDKNSKALPTLGVLRDCLSVSQIYHSHDSYRFVVWQLKDYGVEESWNKIVNISNMDQDLLANNLPAYYVYLKPLCMSENGDVLMETDLKDNAQLVMYKGRDTRLRILHLLGYSKSLCPVIYVESLVSPQLLK